MLYTAPRIKSEPVTNASIFLYTDDIILLTPTITALEYIPLGACESELKYYDIQMIINKVLCIHFAPALDVGRNNLSIDHCDNMGQDVREAYVAGLKQLRDCQ
jgi:hypothetical protein